MLPSTPYDYKDESLPLPYVFKISSEDQIPAGILKWIIAPRIWRGAGSCVVSRQAPFHASPGMRVMPPALHSLLRRALQHCVIGIPLKRNAMALANARYNIHAAGFGHASQENQPGRAAVMMLTKWAPILRHSNPSC